MAFCGKCGQQVNDGVKFCPACGAPMEAAASQPEQPTQEPSQGDSLSNKLSDFNNTTDSTADFNKADIEQNKVMGILAYLSILVLVPILAAPNSKFARFHANQGLVLLIATIGWAIVDGILSAILRAIFLRSLNMLGVYLFCGAILNLVYIAFTVLAIIGIINVVNGRAKELPVIGKFRVLK